MLPSPTTPAFLAELPAPGISATRPCAWARPHSRSTHHKASRPPPAHSQTSASLQHWHIPFVSGCSPVSPLHSIPALRQCSVFSQLSNPVSASQCMELAPADSPLADGKSPTARGLPDISIRRAESAAELESCAMLRAEAYYEESSGNSRFTQSFKQQFARQEYSSLRQRTQVQAGGQPEALCFVAVQASGKVRGTLDMRPPASVSGRHPKGVPEEDIHGAYVLNLVVDVAVRGKGVGLALMAAAAQQAVGHWEAKMIYTHVDSQNEGACYLYRRCGYQLCNGDDWTPSLGKRLLLALDLRTDEIIVESLNC